jgi:hypothetical protein
MGKRDWGGTVFVGCLIALAGLLRDHTMLLVLLSAGAVTSATVVVWDVRSKPNTGSPHVATTPETVLETSMHSHGGVMGAGTLLPPFQADDEMAAIGVLVAFGVDVTNKTTDRPTSVSFRLLLPSGNRVRDDRWSEFTSRFDPSIRNHYDHGPFDLAPGSTQRLKLGFQVLSWDIDLEDNASFADCAKALKGCQIEILDHVSGQRSNVPGGTYPANLGASR